MGSIGNDGFQNQTALNLILSVWQNKRREATEQLDLLYNEIRPVIEEHERDSQDSVATSVAEKWIESSCLKLKAEFDLYSSMIKHVLFTPRRAEADPPDSKSEVQYLTLDSNSSECQKPIGS